MVFNSSVSSNSESTSNSSNYIQKINSVDDLENIIKTAKSNGIKKITVKDYRNSPLKLGFIDLFGNKVKVSPFPSMEKTFIIEFS